MSLANGYYMCDTCQIFYMYYTCHIPLHVISITYKLKKKKERSLIMAISKASSSKDKVEAEECAFCAITETVDGIKLKKCSRCKSVSYCSKACQLKHWNNGGHKRFCIPPKERNPEKFQQEADSDIQDKCPICMDKVLTELSEREAHSLPCSHRFHTKCIITHHKLSSSHQCPVCRAPLPPPSHFVNLEGWDVLVELTTSFKERTGHSLECACHSMNEREENSLQLCVRLFTESAKLGNLDSSFFLGLFYMKEMRGHEQDYERSVHWLSSHAAHGNARAQYQVGVMYLNGGPGLKQDVLKGIKFLRKSVAQGDIEAQSVLGTFLRSSLSSVERKEGFSLLQDAALQLNTAAIYDLGVIYYEGTLTEKDYQLGFVYIEIAATNDLQVAMYMLSGLYKRGHGVFESQELAAEWFIKAERNADESLRTYVDNWFILQEI